MPAVIVILAGGTMIFASDEIYSRKNNSDDMDRSYFMPYVQQVLLSIRNLSVRHYSTYMV